MAASVAPTSSAKTPVVKTTNDPFNAAAQKDMFLKLLVAQLKNQDPTSPMDQKDMMAQMAQFSTVEQLTNLGQQMQALQTNSTFTQSVNLIGKRIDYLAKDGTLITGSTVTAVSSAAGVAKLVLSNGDTIEPAKVSRVS